MPPFFRHPAIPPHPTIVEGEDSCEYVEASQLFNISRNTINLWLKRLEETGDYQAKLNQPPGNGHKITNWEEFREFAQAHGEKTQIEMAKLWKEQISDPFGKLR